MYVNDYFTRRNPYAIQNSLRIDTKMRINGITRVYDCFEIVILTTGNFRAEVLHQNSNKA